MNNEFSVFGVEAGQDFHLLIDYCHCPLEFHKKQLLQLIRCSSDEALSDWGVRLQFREDDIFEIEHRADERAAQEAVFFWREYFRGLGEIIIEAAHLPIEEV